MQAMTRVLNAALEFRWHVTTPARHPVVSWMVVYASLLLNRFEIGHDGKTACARSTGKKAKRLGVEFGEAVRFENLAAWWSNGIYLRIRLKSGKIIVGDARGAWKTRSIQRKHFEDRSSKSAID